MARAAVLLLALIAGCCYADSSTRIVGGAPATIEQYPSIVQVEYLGIFTNLWSQSCAANILNSVYLLTAAHCFYGITYQLERRRIRAGTTLRNVGGIVIHVAEEINHPSYDSNPELRYDGDISVIRLVSPLSFGPTIQQGPIIAQGYQVPDNQPVVHAGWGRIQTGGINPEGLLDVTIFTVNLDLCRERYNTLPNRTVTENMICAGLIDVGGADACQGDSGGPLYYGNIIVGIVSWGEGCAEPFFPGISTAVSSYTDWILSVVGF